MLTHVLLGLLHNFRVIFLSASTTLDNAISECDAFRLTPVEAAAEVVRVVDVVNTWKLHFAKMGVSARDIESLAQQIDGEHLSQQRLGFEPGRFAVLPGKRLRKSPFLTT